MKRVLSIILSLIVLLSVIQPSMLIAFADEDEMVAEDVEGNIPAELGEELGEQNEPTIDYDKICYVTFHFMDDVTEPVTYEVYSGECLFRIESPTREGYTFDDWYYEDGRAFSFRTPITEDTDVYAEWLENLVVTFDLNYEGSESNSVEVAYGSRVSIPSKPVREGYTFIDWYTTADYTQGKVFSFNAQITKDTILYARWEVNPVVTFNLNYEGSETVQIEVDYSGLAKAPSVPVREGYTFIDWYTRPYYTEGEVFDFNTRLTGNIILYARWEANPIVTFDFNLAGSETVQVEVNYNGLVNVPAAPEREGYVIKEWYENPECKGSAFDFTSPITRNVTVYGKWDIRTDDYAYINESGELAKVSISCRNIIQYDTMPESSNLTSGWYVVTQPNVSINSRITISGDVKLLLLDGSSITFANGIKLMQGNTLTIYSESLDESRMGKLEAFGKGNDAAIGTNGENSAGTFNLCGGIVTATAADGSGIGGGLGYSGSTWANNGPDAGVVNVYNGILYASSTGVGTGIGGGAGGNYFLPDGSARVGGNGGKLNVYGGAIYAKSAKHQAIGGGRGGALLSSTPRYGQNGSPVVVNLYGNMGNVGEFNKDANVEIFEVVKVTYHYINEEIDDVVVKIRLGEIPKRPDVIIKDGKSTGEWYLDSSLQKVFNFTTGLTKDTDLYTKLVDDLVISFDYQDGQTGVKTETIHYNSTVSKPQDPTREGYSFMGWYDTPNYKQGKRFDFSAKLKESKTVYAAWEKDLTITINYNYEGSTDKTVIIKYNNKVAKPENPERKGYSFMGWYNAADYKTANVFNFNAQLVADTIVYAGWEKDPIVILDYSGKADSEEFTVPYGEAFSTPAAKMQDGMRVVGWYLDPDFTTPFDEKQSILQDITIYAKWEDGVKYYDENGQEQKLAAECVTIDSNNGFATSTITSGAYLIKGDVTVANRVEIKGDVKFILENGSKIVLENGIKLISGNSLTIYSQSLKESEMGKLEAYGKDVVAAIGANGDNTAGTFNMCGGIVTATAAKGAGVGGGKGYNGFDWSNDGANGGIVNVYNGVLNATSNGASAGIGGGTGGDMAYACPQQFLKKGGNGGTINIYGGKVYAKSANWQAIGGGRGGISPQNIETYYGNQGANATVNIYNNATVNGALNKDRSVEIISNNATGSFLSSGKIIIPAAIAVVAIGAAIVISKKKKAS